MAYSRAWGGAIILVAAAALAGCTAGLPQAAFPIETAYNQPYYLDAGDQLRITVYGQEDLSRTYPVSNAGSVAIPLIGQIAARGRTVDQIETTIVTALAARYLRDPDVSVEVQTYRPFYILGEVRNPGQYPYVSGLTVETAVAIAGGYTYRAFRERAEISRQLAGQVIRAQAAPEHPVAPGDTITVHERLF
jgi:polysaccharide export outer membrane protein